MNIMSPVPEAIYPQHNSDYLRDGQIIPAYKANRSPKRKAFYVGYRGQASMDVSYFYAPYIPGQPVAGYMWDHRAVTRSTTAIQQAIMEAVKFTPMLSHTVKPDIIDASYNKG